MAFEGEPAGTKNLLKKLFITCTDDWEEGTFDTYEVYEEPAGCVEDEQTIYAGEYCLKRVVRINRTPPRVDKL